MSINEVVKVKIDIPSIRDDNIGFYRIWKRLYEQSWDTEKEYFITLDFSKCNYAGINITSAIGAFVNFIRTNLGNSTLKIETKTMSTQVFHKLKDMRLLEALDKFDGHGFTPASDEIIPYKEFSTPSEEVVLTYLKTEWLGKNRLNFSDEVEAAVLSSLWEIYANAFEHSQSNSVFSCGSYQSKDKSLSILVGDSGVGVPSSVKSFLDKNNLSSTEALKWALTRGNSTYTANLKDVGKAQPRGLGLHLLKELVDINLGEMEIFTSDLYYKRKSGDDYYITEMPFVSGSWIKITLNCKKNVKYLFKDEDIPDYF